MEQAIADDLAMLVQPSREIAAWLLTTLKVALDRIIATQRRQRQPLLKRQSELAAMKDRLLTAHLAGTVDGRTLLSKTTDRVNFTLKSDLLRRGDLDEFVECFRPDNRHERKATWRETREPGGPLAGGFVRRVGQPRQGQPGHLLVAEREP